MTARPSVRTIAPMDFDQWLPLWTDYHRFYEREIADAITQSTWARFFDADEPVHALVAEWDGSLLGFAHFLYHRNTSTIGPVCYMQDLFTAEAARGRGTGRTLIEAVYEHARAAGSPRVYWMTHESNQTARSLYDKVAERSGFIQYRKAL